MTRGPIHAMFLFTWRCNSKCLSCNNWQRDPGVELGESEVDALFSSPLLEDVIHVYLTGGEPFLDHRIINICKSIKKHLNATISLNTNGLLPKNVERYGKIIKDMGLDILGFDLSINGPRKIHDYTRGTKGGFNKLMETRQVLEKLDIPFGWNFTIFKPNINYIKWYVNFRLEETHYFAFGLPKGIVTTPDKALFVYSNEELANIYRDCDCKELRSYLNETKNYGSFNNCGMGNHQIRIMPDGEAYVCDTLPIFHLGNMLTLQWETYQKRLQEAKTRNNCNMHCLKEYCIYNYNNIIQKPINKALLRPIIYRALKELR